MGQEEVLNYLKGKKVPLCLKEISDGMSLDSKYVVKKLSLLLKSEDIKCIELDRHQAMIHYKKIGSVTTHRLRLYYYSP